MWERHSGQRLRVVLTSGAPAGRSKSCATRSAGSSRSGAASVSRRDSSVVCSADTEGASARTATGNGLAMEPSEKRGGAGIYRATGSGESPALVGEQALELARRELPVGVSLG